MPPLVHPDDLPASIDPRILPQPPGTVRDMTAKRSFPLHVVAPQARAHTAMPVPPSAPDASVPGDPIAQQISAMIDAADAGGPPQVPVPPVGPIAGATPPPIPDVIAPDPSVDGVGVLPLVPPPLFSRDNRALATQDIAADPRSLIIPGSEQTLPDEAVLQGELMGRGNEVARVSRRPGIDVDPLEGEVVRPELGVDARSDASPETSARALSIDEVYAQGTPDVSSDVSPMEFNDDAIGTAGGMNATERRIIRDIDAGDPITERMDTSGAGMVQDGQGRIVMQTVDGAVVVNDPQLGFNEQRFELLPDPRNPQLFIVRDRHTGDAFDAWGRLLPRFLRDTLLSRNPLDPDTESPRQVPRSMMSRAIRGL